MNISTHLPDEDDEKPEFLSRQVTETQLFFIDAEPVDDDAVAIVCGGREHCRTDYQVKRSGFPHYCLEFVSSGEATLKLGDKNETELTAGAVFTYGPEVPHNIVADPANPPVKYFVDVHGNKSVQLLNELGLTPGALYQTRSIEDVRQKFDDLLRYGRERSSWRERALPVCFEMLAIEVAKNAVPHGSRYSQAFQTFQRCRDIIHEQYLSLKSLHEIAEICSLDQAYLCRLFRRFAGNSPYEYLVQLQMEYAAGLLRQSGLLVKEVAAKMGYSNPYHFSRLFKRVHGMAPTAFADIFRLKG